MLTETTVLHDVSEETILFSNLELPWMCSNVE